MSSRNQQTFVTAERRAAAIAARNGLAVDGSDGVAADEDVQTRGDDNG